MIGGLVEHRGAMYRVAHIRRTVDDRGRVFRHAWLVMVSNRDRQALLSMNAREMIEWERKNAGYH